MKRFLTFAGLFCFLLGAADAAPPGPGLHNKVTVTAPTRLDWTFVLATRSTTPADGDESKSAYQLFVPARKGPKTPLPVLLFVSAGDEPGGWKAFEKLAKSQGILFAAPH